MGMFRRLFCAALGLTVAGGLAAPAPAADAPISLKVSHWLPPSHPLHASIVEWTEAIRKESGGTINGTVFPAEQLGKAVDHYDMTRDGIADAAYVSPGYQPGRFPIIAAGDLPFLYRDGRSGTAALDSWYRQYAATEMSDVHYCFAFVQEPQTLHSRRKVVMPEDVRGLKVRPPNAVMGRFVTLLGGTNVQASAPGSRDVLDRGTADAIFFPWGSLVLFGIDKVTKYDIDAKMNASTFIWVLNKAKYEAMSPAQRTVIDNHCNAAAAQAFAGPWADFEAAGEPKVKAEASHEITPLTADQLAAWRKAAEPLRADWAEGVKKTGHDPDKLYAEFQASLTANKANY